jgi:tetratricopeptide (TPR) repeat protein
VTLFAGKALAQDQAAVDKVTHMNRKALDDYDTLEWEGAKKTLLEALQVGQKAQLGNHPIMARTYVHLGAVYLRGFKNADKALQSFSRALEIDPNIQLTRGIETPEMTEVFAQAKRARTPPKQAPPAVSTPADSSRAKARPVKSQTLDCPNEDEAIIDRPATLRCGLAPGLTQVATVFLMYREPGKQTYAQVQMTRSKNGWFVGQIPKKAVTGKTVLYYFEGRDASGKPVIRNGEQSSPNILLLMEEDVYNQMKRAGKGKFWDNGSRDENPLD